MQITNQQGILIAYLERKIIIHAKTGAVIGLLLDTCVYNIYGKWSGKFFDNIFRNKEGYIIAQFNDHIPGNTPYNLNEIYKKGWDIVEKINRYDCARVPALDVWEKDDLIYFLK